MNRFDWIRLLLYAFQVVFSRDPATKSPITKVRQLTSVRRARQRKSKVKA